MTTYFSTFIPGLGEVVRNQLEFDLKDFRADLLLDGLVVYESNSSTDKVKSLRYLNNSFLQVKPEEKISLRLGKTFRVVFSKENELISINKERLAKIESKIAKLNSLVADRTNPDFEFWFLERSEGYKLTGARITKHPDYKTVLRKGQLRPELANLLCLISDPQVDDIVLDPFAGSGAISAGRATFPHKKILTGDIVGDGKKIAKMDATNLTEIDSGSIDKIITDPPWGISVGLNLNLPDFYENVLSEFYRVLKPKGKVVILIGKKELFEDVLNKLEAKFSLDEKYDILVSGKKAAIYLLVKK